MSVVVYELWKPYWRKTQQRAIEQNRFNYLYYYQELELKSLLYQSIITLHADSFKDDLLFAVDI